MYVAPPPKSLYVPLAFTEIARFLLPSISVKKNAVAPPTTVPWGDVPTPIDGEPSAARARDDLYGETLNDASAGSPVIGSARYCATVELLNASAGGRNPFSAYDAVCMEVPCASFDASP